MRIHLPNSAFLGNIDQFLRTFDPTDPRELSITFNEKWVAVHPVVLCMVAALGLTIPDKSSIHVSLPEVKSRHYFERMGLFKMMGVKSGIKVTAHEPTGRFIPLTQIKDSTGLNHFITDMIPLLHQEPAQAEAIKYVISELVRNVFEHSESPYGAIVCAQYYPKTNSIKIGVVDTGIGIRRTIAQFHSADTDIAAIKLALTPGITGTIGRRFGGTGDNAGVGLFFIKSIAKINHDFFIMYSGNGFYKLLRRPAEKVRLQMDPFDDKCSKRNDLPAWSGTVVGIDITLTQTQPFDSLLELMKEFYQKQKKVLQKAHYKVRFV